MKNFHSFYNAAFYYYTLICVSSILSYASSNIVNNDSCPSILTYLSSSNSDLTLTTTSLSIVNIPISDSSLDDKIIR